MTHDDDEDDDGQIAEVTGDGTRHSGRIEQHQDDHIEEPQDDDDPVSAEDVIEEEEPDRRQGDRQEPLEMSMPNVHF